jgi:hypothetical protein
MPAAPAGEGPLLNVAAPPPIRASDLLWLGLALFIIIGTGIGIRDPWPADEPRFAAVARDMVATGEWLFPRVGGDLYQDKPPMFFWMLAVCYSLIGSIKWSFLIPAFLAAGGTMFLLYDLGRRLVSREAGLAAALLTVTTLQFVITPSRGTDRPGALFPDHAVGLRVAAPPAPRTRLGLVPVWRLRGRNRRDHQGRGFPAVAAVDPVFPDARFRLARTRDR